MRLAAGAGGLLAASPGLAAAAPSPGSFVLSQALEGQRRRDPAPKAAALSSEVCVLGARCSGRELLQSAPGGVA